MAGSLDRKQRLVDLNVRQKAFYEAGAATGAGGNPAANAATRQWTRLRRALLRAEKKASVREAILATHRAWLGDLSGKDVLDLGCYSGNSLSVEIARSAGSYLGLDLSANAIQRLRAKLEGTPGAEARAGDFLAQGFSARFDVIYAHGVLHHFQDFELLCAELHKALRPGGVVIAIDPLQCDPLNRLARWLYRPWQSDKDWEWPFDRRTFEILGRHFTLEAVQGFRGLSKLGLLAGPWGGRITRWGNRLDLEHANRRGLALAACWLVATRFSRPAEEAPDR